MKIRDIALIGILSATITTGKLALSFIPNVEIVTLLFIVYTVVFGIRRSLLTSVVFSTTEIFLYGFSTWLLGYYLVWPLLILSTYLIGRTMRSEYAYAIVGAIFGYAFGLLFAIVESFFYGLAYGWIYWLRGIPFDIIHGTSNFIIILTLYRPILNILTRLKEIHYRTLS
ncbi:MAG: hypothetical protein GX329_04625 [Tissierellia bacterium]|nr:hypothetical protein [Tissierellia bacterium]